MRPDTILSKLSSRRGPVGRVVVIFSGIFLGLGLMAGYGSTFSVFYVFGDSLSDTGRNPATPAGSYYNGRYSNGPLWVEYLSGDLGLAYNASNNFAYSGSETSDLMSQIASVPASPTLHTALFSVMSGGNDFIDNATLGFDEFGWDQVVANAVANITQAVTTLYTNGAREVIVGNLPNLGETPAASGTPFGYPEYVDSKVALFNATLQSAMTNAMQKNAGLRIYPLNLNASFSNILSAPASYGFTVTTVGTLEDTSLTDKSFNGPGADYVFWDEVHPTTKVHGMIATAAYDIVTVGMNLAVNGSSLDLNVNNLVPGLPYTIQSSTDLTTWTTYAAFTASATNSIVPVTNNSSGQVFYRVNY